MRRLLLGAALVATLVPAVARADDPPFIESAPKCGAVGDGPHAPVPERVDIGTYNILHTLDDRADETLSARIELIAQHLRASGADIVGLQEVVQTAAHGNAAERLATRLSELSGDPWAWCWFQSNPHVPLEPDVDGGTAGPLSDVMSQFGRNGTGEFREGIAILSRFAIDDAHVWRQPPRSYEGAFCIDVPPDPLGCNFAGVFDSRAVLRARIGAFDIYNTHVAHGITPLSDTVTKPLQLQLALEYIAHSSRPDATDIFVGDFNTTEDDDRYRIVTDAGFVDSYRAVNPTADGFTSGHDFDVVNDPRNVATERIDYVFVRSEGCGRDVERSSVIGDRVGTALGETTWPSDHFGVVTTLKSASPACR